MRQSIEQNQKTGLKQVLKLTQQQMLQIHLLEMPIAEFEEAVRTEMNDNPYLEPTDHVVGAEDESADINSSKDEYDIDPDKLAEQNDRDQKLTYPKL